MSITRYNGQALALPAPRTEINIRAGTLDDIPFIDALQKKMNRQLGWMPRKQLEGKIGLGHVLVAEAGTSNIEHRTSNIEVPEPERLGYVIGNDQYFKRDDVGCIFQLCVVEGQRRGLIGAALVKAMFERAAYGCRLFCCWCAQDLEANRFWESLGFVPIAFRTGSRTKGKGKTPRVHIFWQKRIREGDTETPYWFPSKTSGGALGEDRLVLPIPPGVHWSDEMPMFLPQEPAALPAGARPRSRTSTKVKLPELVPGMKAEPLPPTPHPRKRVRAVFGPPSAAPPAPVPVPLAACLPVREASTPDTGGAAASANAEAPRQKPRCDPKLAAKARELRDRFLEAAQRHPDVLVPAGKYDVVRALPEVPDQRHAVPRLTQVEVRALPEAA